ncbi:lipoprotein signal peptidase [Cypionkella aquatica]|uniref:Lipoprotein signal peptidase n=1 Tax=Cypionkella aquatica TaxID=1756042 RepID=A0AA37U1C8_9RHOB|nr:signal peptidase II [Cypionkella aquatica]GLS85870.1 lipoprotein signal peptidase [Cypionkella aquatica]
MRALSLTAIIVFLLDQASKLGVIRLLSLRERGEIDVIDPFLNFRWAENRGVNFGLFANSADFMRWVLIAVAVAISAWVLIWLRRERPGKWSMIAGGLLIGGALGNVVDRIAYGYVADFLTMSCCGFENPYSFNVADIAIFAGAIGLVLFSGKSGKSGKPTAPKRRKTP